MILKSSFLKPKKLMIIGIDASRAFLENRTGIEQYSYQTLKHLRNHLKDHQVILYIRKGQTSNVTRHTLPESWKVKVVKWPRFWTQIGLSLEMLLNPVDVLFVPAHTVPIIHPKKTIVTIHGLEYEFCSNTYSFFERLYMRWSIKNSCRWASKIISVSENTKKDLIDLYKVPEKKIDVVYEGYESNVERHTSNVERQIQKPYLLFVGRIEERKNISNIIKAFEILKEKYQIPHKLVLAGKPGHGYKGIRLRASGSRFKDEILEPGFVSEEEKWELLKNADIFVFPTLYEGFGIPVLEAQSVGCPVVASNNSSIPEVVNCHSGLAAPVLWPDSESRIEIRKKPSEIMKQVQDDKGHHSALLINPFNPSEIAENIYKIISDEKLKQDLAEKGLENIKRFSWEKCARQIAKVLIEG